MTHLDAPPDISPLTHSVQAEQSVLGAILLDNAAYDRVVDVVQASDFYLGRHRTLYHTMQIMLENRLPVDAITVAEELECRGVPAPGDDTSWLAEVGDLAQNTPGGANARRYAEIVRDHSIRRQVQSTLADCAVLAQSRGGHSASELLDAVQGKLLTIGEAAAERSDGLLGMNPILTKVIDHLDMLVNRADKNAPTGMATGFADLDAITSGLQPGDLVVVGARPSMGKSALALNVAEHVALRLDMPVAFFSLEMPREQLAGRLLAGMAGINHFMLRKGLVRDDDWRAITDVTAKLSVSALHIDDTSAIDPMELRGRCRRLHREAGGMGLIVVDYVQLMGGGKGDTRQQEIGTYSRALKNIAKELHCPVLALSQVNRGVESRTDKRPNMSDLRESGDIEQDADIVMFLYRDEVYNRDSQDKGMAELIIAKHRNGPLGTVNLAWRGELMRFGNWAGVR